MTTNTQIAKLSEIALLNPKLTENLEDNSLVSFLSMSAVTAETATTTTGEDREYKEVSRGYTSFFDGDVLLAKITPCFENGKIAQAKISHRIGFGSTEFHVIRPLDGKADARYLLHFLRQDYIRIDGARKMTGSAGQRRVPGHFLASLDVPLPPLEEQKRIAEILDRAESLRAMRRQSIEQLNTLTQAIFLEMFGDPVTNPKGWKRLAFGELLANIDSGWSPVCLDRSVEGEEWGVLKLGAVTKCEYKPSENKALPPDVQPNLKIEVKQGDLLFTRKNTYELIAACALVKETPPRLLMSDLIFRFRLREDAPVNSSFLHQLLIYPTKRRAIQKLAGGSSSSMPNISKTKLQDTLVEAPPIDLQQKFAQRVEAIEKLKATHQKSLTELDALFASLQHRAFRGEL